jgi:hypothetical protein
MEELGLKVVMWLIIFTGSFAIVTGSLRALFWLLEQFVKTIGYHKVFIKAVIIVTKQERDKRRSRG